MSTQFLEACFLLDCQHLNLYFTTDKVNFDIFAECAVFSQKVGRLFHPGDSRVAKEELQVSLSCDDPPWFGPRHTSKPYQGRIRDIIILGDHALLYIAYAEIFLEQVSKQSQ